MAASNCRPSNVTFNYNFQNGVLQVQETLKFSSADEVRFAFPNLRKRSSVLRWRPWECNTAASKRKQLPFAAHAEINTYARNACYYILSPLNHFVRLVYGTFTLKVLSGDPHAKNSLTLPFNRVVLLPQYLLEIVSLIRKLSKFEYQCRCTPPQYLPQFHAIMQVKKIIFFYQNTCG